MGYVTLETIVRGAIANKGHSTLHLFVPYLHWAFGAIKQYQREGVYTDIRWKKDYMDSDNRFPFPDDMLMWNKIGVINNGRMTVFVNDDGMSLDPADSNNRQDVGVRGLFSYDSDSLGVLYNQNIYVSTGNGVVQVNFARSNTFRVNWVDRKFQFKLPIGDNKIYIEYIATAHNPSTQTLVNELALEFIEYFIYYREARFKFGASHRETIASEKEWLDEMDELRGGLSDLTANGLLQAVYQGTRKSIDQ